MIQVFCIQLLGEPFLLGEDAEEKGFYHNEFVLALSEQRAIAAAKSKTMKRLARLAPRFIEGKPFTLQVEEVKSGASPLRLLRAQGFLFFPACDPK